VIAPDQKKKILSVFVTSYFIKENIFKQNNHFLKLLRKNENVKKKKNLKTASNEKLFLVAFQNNQFKYN
jgi:hypothetical protein